MARIRSIKPEFWTDEKVVALSPLARLLFIGMWNFVDDEGRAAFSPITLKLQILPADPVEVRELLDEIRGAGLINVYAVDGKEYFEVCGFSKHQKIDKRSTSKLPPPPNSAESPRIPTTDQGREGIKEGKASEAKASSAARDDNEFDLIEGKLRRAAGVESDPSPGLLDLSPVMPFIDAGYSIDRDILPVIRAVAAKQKQKPRSWRYFLPALEEAFARRPEVPDKPEVAEKVFVEKGSDAWRAWCAHAGKTYPETEDRSQGIVRMGWHFPTEYPQAQETAA